MDSNRFAWRFIAEFGGKIFQNVCLLFSVQAVNGKDLPFDRLTLGDELVTADMDMDMVREVRNLWQFFRDRRPETYGPLTAP